MKNAVFLLLFSFPSFSQVDTLEIVRFQARLGDVVIRDSVYNSNEKIILPVPPVFVSITVNEQPEQELICFLSDSLMTFDTLFMGNNPTVNFFNLPGGQYIATFEDIKSKNKGQVQFTIESDFWERWWFPPIILLAFTVVIGIVFYYIYKIQLRQKLRTQLIRDSIARDLHDDIGSYLSSISILSQNVDMMLASNPEKAKTSLAKIGNTAREVMDTMGDIVWSINPNQDTMPLIIQRMKDLMSELFSEQNVLTTFGVDESIKKQNISLEKKRDFYLIFKEAVTNVQKYANASKIDVNIKDEENSVVLTIEDNGIGFDIERSERKRSNGGNGLINMEMRARRLGGTLNIVTERGKGTTVSLMFPK